MNRVEFVFATVFRILGTASCISAAYLSVSGNMESAQWLFPLGIYFLGKGDYFELKEKL